MKKSFIILAVMVIAYACGNQENNNETNGDSTEQSSTEPTPAPTTQDITENPDYQKGLELIAKSDCLTCHKVDEKAIGPAYREVANKYAADDKAIDSLASKIIKGGSGVWGTVPMTPHPTVSTDDAKQMVKYILLLKNK